MDGEPMSEPAPASGARLAVLLGGLGLAGDRGRARRLFVGSAARAARRRAGRAHRPNQGSRSGRGAEPAAAAHRGGAPGGRRAGGGGRRVPGPHAQPAGRALGARRVERRRVRRDRAPRSSGSAAASWRRSAWPPSPSRARCVAGAAVYLIASRAGRAARPHPAAGRRDRRHLLLLGHHRAHLGRGLQPAGRRGALAARQSGPDRARPAWPSSRRSPAGRFWLVIGAARRLNLLALGEEAAQQLGVDAERRQAPRVRGRRPADPAAWSPSRGRSASWA